MNEFDAFLELAGMLATDGRFVVLAALLICAATIDVRSRRIPNWLTVSGALYGLLYSAFVPFYLNHGILWSLGGWALALGVLFPLWMLRVMGAGDVKLMAMAGALLGLHAIPAAIAGSLIAGGVLAVGYALRQRKLRLMLVNTGRMIQLGGVALATRTLVQPAAAGWQSVGKLPFGLAIACGTLVTVVATHFGFL